MLVCQKYSPPSHSQTREQNTIGSLITQADSGKTFSLDQKQVEMDSVIQNNNPRNLKHVPSGFLAESRDI